MKVLAHGVLRQSLPLRERSHETATVQHGATQCSKRGMGKKTS
ncbi:hypothetical protein AB4Y45_08250 [Paraburkholderia sp. EG287A]